MRGGRPRVLLGRLHHHGGIGGDFYYKQVLPRYQLERKAAKANGENEWEVVRRHQRWLDRVSIVIARCNYELLCKLPRRNGEPISPHQAAGFPDEPDESFDL